MSDTEYTSIRVKRDTKEQAQKAKRGDETWDEFILRCSDEPSIHMTESDIERVAERVADQRIRELVVADAQQR